MPDTIALIIPAFVAGVLTFVAPCTLPLVPAYLAFISGVSLKDIHTASQSVQARRKLMVSAVLFVLGFSAVFIFFGALAGLGGVALAQYRPIIANVGALVVILFGLYMTGLLRLPALSFLEGDHHLSLGKYAKPGSPFSSLLFGMAFAVGWTPCIGPILGSVLTLAASSATVGRGALLLAVFSLGLALPFLVIAVGVGSAARFIKALNPFLHAISIIGGIFLIVLGVLILTNLYGEWAALFYRIFSFIHYDALLNYL
ncbi:MAG: cytochrome c biogenesis protein CcdA [Candidatus Uhrbacteria bacterium]|nr:cytochrome c biogenesis protein CcdA [Candidatus Uhrbacteria bacterium]